MKIIQDEKMFKEFLEGKDSERKEVESMEEVGPEEALAFLTNLLVEMAFYKGMPVNVLLLAIEMKYGMMEKAYQLAGPDDEVH
jgi:hypothetical protein